jgi:hypothetical protein
MAGGISALSGIVIIPMIAIGTWYTHRKAGEVEEETRKVVAATNMLTEQCSQLADISQTATEHSARLREATTDLNVQIATVGRRLYPAFWLSSLIRRVRTWFGRPYYSPTEETLLVDLDRKLALAANLFGGSEL